MTKNITKRTLAGVLAVLCIAGTLPTKAGSAMFEGSSISADALDVGPVPIDKPLIPGTTAIDSGSFVVENDLELSSLAVGYDANIIIYDSCTLTIKDGLTIVENRELWIESGKEGTGRLIVNAEPVSFGDGKDAINGNIVVKNANLEANGGQTKGIETAGGVGIRGSLTVYGGTVNVTGGAGGVGSGANYRLVGDNGAVGSAAIEGDITVYEATHTLPVLY